MLRTFEPKWPMHKFISYSSSSADTINVVMVIKRLGGVSQLWYNPWCIGGIKKEAAFGAASFLVYV